MNLKEYLTENLDNVKIYKVKVYKLKKKIENDIKIIKTELMPSLNKGQEQEGMSLAKKERNLKKLKDKLEEVINFINMEILNEKN